MNMQDFAANILGPAPASTRVHLLVPAVVGCCCTAVLHEHRPQLPTNMLALMTELEKQGPAFASKMLITIVGEQQLDDCQLTQIDMPATASPRDMVCRVRLLAAENLLSHPANSFDLTGAPSHSSIYIKRLHHPATCNLSCHLSVAIAVACRQ